MAQKTAGPFRTQVGKGFGRLDWPRSPPNSPSFLPSLATTTKDWAGGWRDWHRLGQAYCLCSPALDPLPGTTPSLPPLPSFLLPEEPAMSQDTWFLLDLVPILRLPPGDLTNPALWQRTESPSFQEHIQNSLEIREKCSG